MTYFFRLFNLVLINFCMQTTNIIAQSQTNTTPSTSPIPAPKSSESKQATYSSKLVNEIRSKFIKDNLDKEQCITLPLIDTNNKPVTIDLFQKNILQISDFISTENIKLLLPFFHTRLQVDEKKLTEMFLVIKQSIGKIQKITKTTSWLINNPAESAGNIRCEQDKLSLYKHLAYPIQFSNWIELEGSKEKAKIYLSLVPDRQDELKIASWHFQRWTHNGKDAETWIKIADELPADKRAIEKILSLDIAQKLLDFRHFIKLDLREQTLAQEDKLGGMKFVEQSIKDFLKVNEIQKVKSLLAPEGLGINLDFVFEKELSLDDRTDLCKKTLLKLFKAKEMILDSLVGGRCAYYMKGENLENESKIGGRYIPKKDLG